MTGKTNWIELSSPVRSEAEQGVYSAAYYLKDVAGRGGVDPELWKKFQAKTQLDNFYWRAYWSRGDLINAGGRSVFPQKVSAVVVFMHGWDGCAEIWENLPGRLLTAAPNVLALAPDVNGFSRSPFKTPDTLDFTYCNPAANMKAIELWLEMLGILGGRRYTPVVFVGHSMSGAALFYLSPTKWTNHPIGRVALAPALLMNDLLRKGFYRTLGMGIWASHQLQISQISDTLSPMVVNQLIKGASKPVQAAHEKVFKTTDKRTLATTFYAMGQADAPTTRADWGPVKVILGHDDRLVGVSPMLSLVADLGITSRQVRVVLGDHYFFSVGRRSFKLHQESREIAFEEILRVVQEVAR